MSNQFCKQVFRSVPPFLLPATSSVSPPVDTVVHGAFHQTADSATRYRRRPLKSGIAYFLKPTDATSLTIACVEKLWVGDARTLQAQEEDQGRVNGLAGPGPCIIQGPYVTGALRGPAVRSVRIQERRETATPAS
ncbi:hypothetical protein J6590_071731 [Homalodisca vitripennis]|nr:hypothetical protein J6590_071731 [Homalodisca vitripennis]